MKYRIIKKGKKFIVIRDPDGGNDEIGSGSSLKAAQKALKTHLSK